MTRQAAIVRGCGNAAHLHRPEAVVYKVRAGKKGTGRVLFECDGSGDVGERVALEHAEDWARLHGIELSDGLY